MIAKTRFDDAYTLTINTTETLLQLVANANLPVEIQNVDFSCAGTDATGEPILLQLIVQTTAGTASAADVTKIDNEATASVQSTAQKTFTVEPTSSAVLKSWYVHPAGGGIDVWLPRRTLILAPSVRLAMRVIVPNDAGSAVDVCGGMILREF